MRKIRIGNDIAVQWSLVAKGTGEPFVVEGKDIRLSLKSIFATTEIEDFTAQGNTIAWTFKGAEQKQTGIYSLVVSVVDAQGAMVTTDVCQFVELVACSCEADGADEAGVHTESIDLVSNVEIASGTTNPSEVMLLIEELQNTKIDKQADDYYPQLSVGTADNLSGVDEVDSEFSFRRSGGGAIADGVARVQSIKGNSVVWNQALKNNGANNTVSGVTITKVGNEWHCSGVATDDVWFVCNDQISVNAGHKYLYKGCPSGGSTNTYLLWEGSNYLNSDDGNGSISTLEVDRVTPFIVIRKGTDASGLIYKPVLIDLTQMFGAGNEPSTIEEYNARKPFVEDEYAYNEGEVIHMTAEGIKSVGRNIFNEEWELGGLDDNGQIVNYNEVDNARSLFIRLIGGKTYYFNLTDNNSYIKAFAYDENYNLVSLVADMAVISPTKHFLFPSNATYMRFRVYKTDGITIATAPKIMLGIYDGEYLDYEPYTENAEDLSIVAKYFHNGMRSAGAAHDEIRYNKQTNKWEKVVRIGVVDMGELSWAVYESGKSIFQSEYLIGKAQYPQYNSIPAELVCARYVTKKWYDGGNGDGIYQTENGIGLEQTGMLYVADTAYTDPTSFKTAMSGVMLYYELAKPIVTEIKEKDFNLDYKVWNCGTEQMVASKPSSALSADITYGFNAVGLIKQLRSMLEALSAKVANL